MAQWHTIIVYHGMCVLECVTVTVNEWKGHKWHTTEITYRMVAVAIVEYEYSA